MWKCHNSLLYTFFMPTYFPLICLIEEAPTAQMTLSKTKQTVEMLKEKTHALEEKVESLTEERNFLRETLEEGKFPLHTWGTNCELLIVVQQKRKVAQTREI